MDLTGAVWHKSRYSGGNGGNCVEIAEVWRKSSYSGGNGGDCVEVARALPAAIAVRDSKDPDGPKLIFTPADWAAFTQAVRASA
jgi:Domain of unknown function (DUF397)